MSTMPPPGDGGRQDPDHPQRPPYGPPPGGPYPGGEQPPREQPPQGRSSFGQPPHGQPPYGGPPPGGGQEPPYGPPPGGGQPPYGQGPYGAPPPYGPSPYAQTPELGASWRRLVARIIDSVIVGIIGWVLALPFIGTHANDWTGSDQYAISFITIVVYFLYDGFQNALYGRTLGKRALDLRIVRVQDGGDIETSAGFARSAVYTLPPLVPCFGTLFWLVDVLWHLWDHPWRQCLHDKAARTTVIRNRGR